MGETRTRNVTLHAGKTSVKTKLPSVQNSKHSKQPTETRTTMMRMRTTMMRMRMTMMKTSVPKNELYVQTEALDSSSVYKRSMTRSFDYTITGPWVSLFSNFLHV